MPTVNSTYDNLVQEIDEGLAWLTPNERLSVVRRLELYLGDKFAKLTDELDPGE